MPTYDYRCRQCGREHALRHAVHAQTPACPVCGGDMDRWILSAPAVQGGAARGREQAVKSLPACGKGCRCCP